MFFQDCVFTDAFTQLPSLGLSWKCSMWTFQDSGKEAETVIVLATVHGL